MKICFGCAEYEFDITDEVTNEEVIPCCFVDSNNGFVLVKTGEGEEEFPNWLGFELKDKIIGWNKSFFDLYLLLTSNNLCVVMKVEKEKTTMSLMIDKKCKNNLGKEIYKLEKIAEIPEAEAERITKEEFIGTVIAEEM